VKGPFLSVKASPRVQVKASQCLATGEGLFDESYRSSSRWMFAERPIWLSVKKISKNKKMV
jgi:hypothetical protein